MLRRMSLKALSSTGDSYVVDVVKTAEMRAA